MMGGKTPETCWVTHKLQVINLWNCCILLVELFELIHQISAFNFCKTCSNFGGKSSRYQHNCFILNTYSRHTIIYVHLQHFVDYKSNFLSIPELSNLNIFWEFQYFCSKLMFGRRGGGGWKTPTLISDIRYEMLHLFKTYIEFAVFAAIFCSC
jgi:hypothetical protein